MFMLSPHAAGADHHGGDTTNELLSVRGSKGLLSTLVQRPAGSEDRQPVVILMHGFGGNKGGQLLTLTADSLLARGIAVVRFDFNGHGQSKGKFEEMTVPNEIEDAKCIYNYVMQQPWADTTRIALAGHSQGGVVASMTAGELGARKVAAVVLLAPAAVLRDDAIRGNTMGAVYNPLDPPATIALMGGRLKLGADYVRTAFRLPIYETAGRYQGPACIIHGTGDRVVPYTYGERYHELWKGSEYDELPGFDHGFSQDVYRVAELTALFLSKTLR
ncbi:MAG: alpha/beta fold hydrolase [Prevotella sp.]|nr:alpha/beta fold hydrolase [Prevotella sp.]